MREEIHAHQSKAHSYGRDGNSEKYRQATFSKISVAGK
jgi:hypothetical protein